MLQFFLAEDDRNKVVSAIALVEARSAICRLRRGGRLVPDEARTALDAIILEVKRIVQQPTDPGVLSAANDIIDRYYLRALDAIQLGSAVVARDLLAAPDMRFISSDIDLLAAAQAEGFAVWDPTT